MAKDYTKIAATAKRLVEKFGRTMTFIRLDRSVDDSTKPWRANADPRATPDASTDVIGVQIHPDSSRDLGSKILMPELISATEKIVLVAATSTVEDLTTYEEVLDDGVRYKINRFDVLEPGDTRLLYFFAIDDIGS